MALRGIRKYPDRVLKEKAGSITSISGETQALIEDMVETMHAARGVGLAANQVGELKSLCVIDLGTREESIPLIVLINPVIVEREGLIDAEEACLSVPGYMTNVRRAEKVFVKGVDRNGKEIQIEASGLLARALQHEIDHLEGYLFVDRLSPLKRQFFKRRYKKLVEEKAEKERSAAGIQ
jgi:peptide deformylase